MSIPTSAATRTAAAEALPAPARPSTPPPSRRWWRPRHGRTTVTAETRGLVSAAEWASPGTRRVLNVTHALLLILLVVVCLGPMLWLVKASVTSTQDTLRNPMSLFPHGIDWQNIATAWTDVHISLYFRNSMLIALGSWAMQMLVATTAGFALSVLRPKYGRILYGLVLATLFVPSVVLLVPLYLIVLHPPLLGVSLLNSWWAVWLPAGANAFNILLTKRFFDNLPREVFEAARMDGAGAFRLFFLVVLPMSKPILGVVSVFAFIASWKDFLWPLIVLPDPAVQPLSVRLPALSGVIELDVFLAALMLSTLLPVMIFLVFQRVFLRSGGLGGAVKG